MDDKERMIQEALVLKIQGLKLETIKVCQHCRQSNIIPKNKKMNCWKCGKELD